MVLSERLLTAQKEYVCTECHHPIQAGASYWRLVGWAHHRSEGIQMLRFHHSCYVQDGGD